MEILKFITAGNVDDGKSTLIGRLLFDTHNVKSDVLESVIIENETDVNLAHITDGLRTERQQGITIDVAYKYFSTLKRKYIIVDAPGHLHYTKNLVTGASGADVMIILIDAQKGITEQTKRHSFIASFLKIKSIIVGINKMDILGYQEREFDALKTEYLRITSQLQFDDLIFIPISALHGENVTNVSANMPWYSGLTLLEYLENINLTILPHDIARLAIQCTVNSNKEVGYAGLMLSGKLKIGESITIYPDGTMSKIHKIMHGYCNVSEAYPGQNVVLYLENSSNAKRGNVISHPYDKPIVSTHLIVTIFWLNSLNPLKIDYEYVLRINATEIICWVTKVVNKVNIDLFEEYTDGEEIEVNQFANVIIETRDKISFDLVSIVPENGRGILIDMETNDTAGVFIINS